MPTKYDVFAELIERAPCKIKDLPFKVPVYNHVESLRQMGWIRANDNGFVPVVNDQTKEAFKIIRYCLKNGLSYDLFFSSNAGPVIDALFDSAPDLRPEKFGGNKNNTRIYHYLEENQFLLVSRLRPRLGIALKHQLLDSVLRLEGKKVPESSSSYLDIEDKALGLQSRPLNPFAENIFNFISGSARLEGATITPGETREILMHDIYPDKPPKDIQMVKNLDVAMRYALDHIDEKLTVKHIQELNSRIMFSLHRGAGIFKKNRNRIQGNPSFRTADPHDVPDLLMDYCRRISAIDSRKHCLEDLGYIHNQLQYIHPFPDGNSRTTRIVLNWVMQRCSLPMLIIRTGSFDEYMKLTKLSGKRDDEMLAKLFWHILVHEELISGE